MVQIITIEPKVEKERALREVAEIDKAVKHLVAIRKSAATKTEAELLGRISYEVWSLKRTVEGL